MKIAMAMKQPPNLTSVGDPPMNNTLHELMHLDYPVALVLVAVVAGLTIISGMGIDALLKIVRHKWH